jgi:pimeloyl-ACP methyl ester carboxylesterase
VHGRQIRGATVALALVAALLPIAAAPATATAPTPDERPRRLAWTACDGGFQCSSLLVPVDYDDPDGEQVAIALSRVRARTRADRIGVLVVNFGGPGDPTVQTLRGAIDRFPAVVRDRFDIVGFDPRGTGDSRAIDCFDDATADRLNTEDPTPDDAVELHAFYDRAQNDPDDQACITRFGTWLAQIGTVNVARDLDRIRVALRERTLNFLGYSYGTVLGAAYTRSFPTRVRAMVLDAAVNLSDDATAEMVSNAEGFERALDAFLADCAADARCAFHSGGDPRSALLALRDRFESGLTLPTRDGRRAGVAAFYTALVAALYDRTDGWPALATALRQAQQGSGTVLQLLTDLYNGRDDSGRYDNIQEASGAIHCADRPDAPVSFAAYVATLADFRIRFPIMGPLIAGWPIGCPATLPRPDDANLVGDLRARAAAPVLIIGNTDDPATPYAGALDLHERLRPSRVLTLEATDHGAYAKGNLCIDRVVHAYLVSRRLPRSGTRCSS